MRWSAVFALPISEGQTLYVPLHIVGLFCRNVYPPAVMHVLRANISSPNSVIQLVAFLSQNKACARRQTNISCELYSVHVIHRVTVA